MLLTAYEIVVYSEYLYMMNKRTKWAMINYRPFNFTSKGWFIYSMSSELIHVV